MNNEIYKTIGEVAQEISNTGRIPETAEYNFGTFLVS